jgi:hypothetical protein
MNRRVARQAGRGGSAPRETNAGFGFRNIVAFAAAAAVIVTGYVLLDRGSVTAAPLLLVLGYGVLIPVGLLFGLRPGGE